MRRIDKAFFVSLVWPGLLCGPSACTRGAEGPPAAAQESPSAAPAPSAAGQGVAVEFLSTPDPLEAGRNTIEVTVMEAGSPVTDATVSAVFSMPAMPSMNMPAMRSDAALTHVAGGRYRGVGEISMGGTWNVAVTVTRAGRPLATKKLSVVAK